MGRPDMFQYLWLEHVCLSLGARIEVEEVLGSDERIITIVWGDEAHQATKTDPDSPIVKVKLF
jgi:hypothetical protein